MTANENLFPAAPTVSLALLRRRRACKEGVSRSLAALGRTPGEDEPVSLLECIDSTMRLDDVVYAAFQTRPGREAYRAWIVDVYEARRLAALEVLPIFERDCPGDDRVRKALDAYPAGYAAIRGANIEGGMDAMLDARADAASAASAAYAAYAADAAYAAYAAYAADAASAAYAASAASAAYAAWRQSFRVWCRARLRARFVGDAAPVDSDAALSIVLAALRAAVVTKMGAK